MYKKHALLKASLTVYKTWHIAVMKDKYVSDIKRLKMCWCKMLDPIAKKNKKTIKAICPLTCSVILDCALNIVPLVVHKGAWKDYENTDTSLSDMAMLEMEC